MTAREIDSYTDEEWKRRLLELEDPTDVGAWCMRFSGPQFYHRGRCMWRGERDKEEMRDT